MGRPPTPWQQLMLDVGGERLDGPDSPFAYHTVIVFVGRRCGKTATEMGVPLSRALAGPIELPDGRKLPFRGAHTAQNLVRARERFLEDLAEPWIATIPEEDRKARLKLSQNLATTSLIVRQPDDSLLKSEIQVFAPTPTSMRSAGLAHIGIDEALVFTAEQGQALLAAARPTMATMKGHAQLWVMSNVGLAMQSWLPVLRDMGRAAVTSGSTEGICYIEYSMPGADDDDAPDGLDPHDEASWWRYYPALGDGLVRIEELRADLALLGWDTFAAEYMDLWPGSDDPGTPAVDVNDWIRAVRPGAGLAAGAPMWAGVDMNPDGTELAMLACGVDGRGGQLAQVARVVPVASARHAADLLAEWHRERPNLQQVGYDPKTMATAALWAAAEGVPMEPVEGARWGQALKDLVDRLGDGLGHPHAVGDPLGDVLVRHLAAARTKKSGEVAVVSRERSVGPVSAACALMMAVHVAGRNPPQQPFQIR